MSKLKIAFFFGGVSPEHEVSIITAVQAMAALPPEYESIPVYVGKTGEIYAGNHLKDIASYSKPLHASVISSLSRDLSSRFLGSVRNDYLNFGSQKFDVIFPVFHGGIGEGGWIQGMAEFYQVPIVGTGLTGAALGLDKVAMKAVFDGTNIQQAPYIWFYRHDWYTKQATFVKEITSHLKYPIFVKPSRGGSSIGTSCAKNKVELIRAIDLAAALDTRIVVEEGIIAAREINISVMGNAGHELECSVCEEVFHEGSEFLDFKDKYLTGEGTKGMAATYRQIPAKIDSKISEKIQEIAKLVFNLFDCAGLVRLDFLVKDQEIYCIELNTIPGSLAFYIWDKCGYTYPQLLDNLIKLALAKHAETRGLQTDFASPILTNISSNGKLGSKLTGKY